MCGYSVILWLVRVATVAMEKQEYAYFYVGVNVDFNNIKVFSADNEMQQWVSFAMLSSCKIFRTAVNTVAYQNSFNREIKRGLKPGNVCYHSLQNLSYSRLLYKNFKIKIHRTIILSVVLYGCETWSLTLREECRLRVFENMMLRRILGPRRDEVTGEWRNYKMRSLMICTPHQILFGWWNREWDG